MAIYDTIETKYSKEYLIKLAKELGEGMGVLGGWAVHFLVNENFRNATGNDYPESRDIDIFIDTGGDVPQKLKLVMENLGFIPSGYPFRYQLIADRTSGRIISENESKKRPLYELVYIFLDVFGGSETKAVRLWAMPLIKEIFESKDSCILLNVEGTDILFPPIDILLALKAEGFLGRENEDKKYKDAADIYSLIFYSGKVEFAKLRHGKSLKEALKIMAEQEPYTKFIARVLFMDELKFPLVKANLLQVIESIET